MRRLLPGRPPTIEAAEVGVSPQTGRRSPTLPPRFGFLPKDRDDPTTLRRDRFKVPPSVPDQHLVMLELSRSTWLATSLSPGRGEKMSKHSVSAGDIAALLARLSELRRKACARTGKSFPIVVIQEAGLDGFFTVSG
jgi:hypothetical protein